MLRIVKMVFSSHSSEAFLKHFHNSAPKIRAFPGCLSLQLLRNRDQPHIFFTYSEWKSTADLEAYRKSELFTSTWARVKPLFREKPQAWSVDQIWHE